MARFWESRPQEFVSQFVPENLQIQQGYFDDLQKKQDAYKLKIEGLNKQTDALVNDIPGAIESKKRLEGQISGLREVNYNDPIQREQALKGIKQFQYELSPFGELGARDKKKKEYDAFQKELDSRYKDNPMMKSYMTKKLKEENIQDAQGNPRMDRAIKFENGNPINTEIVPPREFTYKDKNDELTKWLKDTEFDQISQNSGLSKEQGHVALYNYMNGNIQEKTGEKIYNALKARALGDPNLLESLKAEANYFYKDENKAESILEQAIQGVVAGGKFKRTNLDRKYLTDDIEAYNAKKGIDTAAEQQRFTTETGATENAGNWAKIAGLEELFNEDGTVKTAGVMDVLTAPLAGTDEAGMSQTGLSLDKSKKVTKNKEEQTKNALTELYKKTTALGLNVKRPDGTLDGNATKENAINYFKGLSVYSNYTVPFQDKNIVENISNDMFGKTSNIHNMEIYEQGNPESKGKYESKDEKAKFKDSKAIGLDYTSTKPGAIKFIAPEGDYGDKPFIGISRNKTLQQQMAPVQELTVKSINGARTGEQDEAAVFLTKALSGNTVKDVYGHSIKLEQLGIPVASSRDLDGTLRVSYLDNSTGSPMIQVLEKSPGKPVAIKSLDEVQQEKTGEIFNTQGALSQYQKQSSRNTLPTTDYEE